ncbi:dNTP triphosphohydrolase [Fodinicola feengrottensis]|uniref:DNTP triphosphohydrolase n=1 Tax=Fodinicola feengrottensis TaxID=435914 RepID=A0ABN2J6P5_9ACTN
MKPDDPRVRRSHEHGGGAGSSWAASDPYRADRDRVVESPFFARLAGVTQVVSPTGSGLLLHNRLTHSLKVAQVAVRLAERVSDVDAEGVVARLGGCDPTVVEAAALAHDLGHPPFGHLGEQVLDRLARQRLGLPDGFEGNAQSFRIITTTDVRARSGVGMDLTAAVRAAVLKYPWARRAFPRPHPSAMPVPPRGAAPSADDPDGGSLKFSAYLNELDEVVDCRAPYEGLVAPWQQTVEAAVMDTADDIAYAIHDIEDFHRVGVLAHTAVAAELEGWLGQSVVLARLADPALGRQPGHGLETRRRRMRGRDSWIYDDDAFAAAVQRVSRELGDGLLSTPFDGSIAAERAVAEFSGKWTERLVDGVRVLAEPPVRAAHVSLEAAQWHEVQVLKFLHQRFVLERPDLALHQRGQAQSVTTLVEALAEWLDDAHESARLPRRLHDLIEIAHGEYARIDPEWLGGTDILRLARGRAIIDFVASQTDSQARAMIEVLSGRSGRLWTDTFVL